MVNRRTISFTLVLALASLFLLLQSSFVSAKGGPKILEWQTMVGVPQAFTGTANQAKIRDGWTSARASCRPAAISR